MNKKKLSDLVVVVNNNDSINHSFEKMGFFSRKVRHPGLCLILDKKNFLLGIVRQILGELLQLFELPISRIMNKIQHTC